MADKTEDLAKLLAGSGKRPGSRRWWLGGLLILALAAGGYYWSRQGSGSATIQYTTEKVEKSALTVTVTATGTVEPTTEVDVSSELSGTLAAVNVDYNDAVTAGQVLAVLDTTKLQAQMANAKAQLDAAAARVLQAEATAREALADLQTQTALSERGVITKKDMTSFEAANLRAEASVAIAKADQTLAEANLDLAKADLEGADITSPIAGIVLNRAAEVGQTVASSLSAPVLFTLAGDLKAMRLLVDIDEADIGRVANGNQAVFTVDAYENTEFPATITQVRYAPETTNDVVTYKAVLAVENPDGLLRPGMTATATIIVAEVTDALIVSNAALRYAPPKAATSTSGTGLVGLILPMPGSRAGAGTATGKSLWVLRDGVPVEVAVTLGESDGKRTVITGDLAEGDLVITDQETKAN